jgi:CRP-like cAMP-binding protein
MELAQILKGIELFQGLSAEQLQRLASISQKETYNAETAIFGQGSPGDKMYVVGDGQVEIRVADGSGSQRAALYLGQGQIFGEMALLDHGPRSASVIAIQDNTSVYAISSAAFMNLCQTDTAIGFIMMRNLAMDLSFKLRHRNLDPAENL